jgi:hypothetical protein
MPTTKNETPPSHSTSKPASPPQPASHAGKKVELPKVNPGFPGTETGGPPP